jgi:CRP/FNR family putative post-exponential-phase nitrogen-starvation transcriptional regulator
MHEKSHMRERMMKEIQNESFKNQLIKESGYVDKFSMDVIHHSHLFHVQAGDYIVREGTLPTTLFYLVRGRTKLYVTLANGRISLVDFFSAPCFIGEIEVLDELRQSRGVQAIEECWCLALPVKTLRTALLNDSLFLRNVCLGLVEKNSRNIVTSARNQAYPLINRLAAFILLTEHDALYKEKHTQVAEYLGVTYRHLLYVIAQLCRQGILLKLNAGYAINNKKALTLLAQEMEPNTIVTGN